MIRIIKGTMVEKDLFSVVIDVGGIGYLVETHEHIASEVGETISLHTYLSVRENALDLYGFVSKEALSMFELLITLQSVGPKSAMHILSQAEIELLKKAALAEDASYLTKMSGIGKKTAEKIVYGLKDKLEADETLATSTKSGDGDVIDALIALGYGQKEAREAIQNIPPSIEDTNERIKAALKLLGSTK